MSSLNLVLGFLLLFAGHTVLSQENGAHSSSSQSEAAPTARNLALPTTKGEQLLKVVKKELLPLELEVIKDEVKVREWQRTVEFAQTQKGRYVLAVGATSLGLMLGSVLTGTAIVSLIRAGKLGPLLLGATGLTLVGTTGTGLFLLAVSPGIYEEMKKDMRILEEKTRQRRAFIDAVKALSD
jgi:hypothetical protein